MLTEALQREKIYFGLDFKVPSIMVEKSGRPEPEAAGHFMSIFRREQWMPMLPSFLSPFTGWHLLSRESSLHSERAFPYPLVAIKIIPHRHAQRAFQVLQIVSNWQLTFNFYEPAFVFSFIKFREDQTTWRSPLRVKGKASVWGQYCIWTAVDDQLKSRFLSSVLDLDVFVF